MKCFDQKIIVQFLCSFVGIHFHSSFNGIVIVYKATITLQKKRQQSRQTFFTLNFAQLFIAGICNHENFYQKSNAKTICSQIKCEANEASNKVCVRINKFQSRNKLDMTGLRRHILNIWCCFCSLVVNKFAIQTIKSAHLNPNFTVYIHNLPTAKLQE